MRLLPDAQCWLWWFAQPEKLSENVIEQIANESNEVWFSVARMLIAQAQVEDITLVSTDATFNQYAVSLLGTTSRVNAYTSS